MATAPYNYSYIFKYIIIEFYKKYKKYEIRWDLVNQASKAYYFYLLYAALLVTPRSL